MLESLLSEKGGRKPLRGDLKESSLPEFEAFHKTSFFFGHLLNFSGKQSLVTYKSFVSFYVYELAAMVLDTFSSGSINDHIVPKARHFI